MHIKTRQIHQKSIVGMYYLSYYARKKQSPPLHPGLLCEVFPAVFKQLMFELRIHLILLAVLVSAIAYLLIIFPVLLHIVVVMALGIVTFLCFLALGFLTVGVAFDSSPNHTEETITLAKFSWVPAVIIGVCEAIGGELVAQTGNMEAFLGFNGLAGLMTCLGLFLLVLRVFTLKFGVGVARKIEAVESFLTAFFVGIKDRVCVPVDIVFDEDQT